MPKLTDLVNQNVRVERGTELDQDTQNDGPVVLEKWTIIFTDKTYFDQVRVTFGKEVRDEIVRGLTGVVIGDPPKEPA